MSAVINCTLTATINGQAVATALNLVSTNIGTPVAGAQVIGYDAYSNIGSGSPSAITMPAATCWAVYVKNLGATNNLLVTCTPAGGSAWASPLVLLPGASFLYWAPYSAAPGSGGITALSLQGSGGATPAEILLAG